jgi:predicted Rossmann fold nucleotide-binding protein DprA/Smf involved in DNA uptake
MTPSAQSQAILLLTARFSGVEDGGSKPLTPKEWGRFAAWLKEKQLSPESLLRGGLAEALDGWQEARIPAERITQLLDRGAALGIALEKWQRAGLWVLTRADRAYPARLKKQLREAAPPVLFGCGDQGLLNLGGLAVVGSRKASPGDLAYARDLGKRAAWEGYTVVSGGARGVDSAAMEGALAVEGTVVGVLADNLLRAVTSRSYRTHIMNGNLVLLSPYHPEARFTAGNAMGRNKYIYCLADLSVVVHSGDSGGTWNGALENLKKAWVPLWVKRTRDDAAGNAALVQAGGRWLEDEVSSIFWPDLVGMTAVAGRDTSAVSEAAPVSSGVEAETTAEAETGIETDAWAGAQTVNETEAAQAESSASTGLVSASDVLPSVPRIEDEAGAVLMASEGDSLTAPTVATDAVDSDGAATIPDEALATTRADEQAADNASDDPPCSTHVPSPGAADVADKEPPSTKEVDYGISLYELFLKKLEEVCDKQARPEKELKEILELEQGQLRTWLKRAVESGVAVKESKPVRYRMKPDPGFDFDGTDSHPSEDR